MRRQGSLVFALVVAAGCGSSAAPAPKTPTLLAAGPAEVAVGQAMTFVGADFFPRNDLRTDIELDGIFTDLGGAQEAVSHLRFSPHRQDANTLVWTNFGPFGNPFVQGGDRLGTFNGTAVAINTATDGSGADEARSQPLPVTLTVEPSIVIRSLQPKDNADCPGPVKRVLGAIPYVITVAAVGFTPVNFSFVISGEPGADGSSTLPQPRIYRVPAQGNEASFGDGDTFLLFEPVPADLSYYVASLEVDALDTDGRSHGARYTFGVHNPIEYITTGGAQTAEIYRPEPVSDCYGGGVNGTTQMWTESTEDTQQRQIGATWDQSWLDSHSVSSATTETNQVTLAVEDSTTDGWSAGWNNSVSNTNEVSDSNSWNWGVNTDASEAVTVGASVGVDIFGAQIGASTSATSSVTVGSSYGQNGTHETRSSVTGSYGQNFDQNHADTHSATVGHDYSASDTESWSYEQSQTVAKGGSSFWTVSTATTTSHSTEVSVLPGQQAMVYRQRVRLKYPGIIVRYDLCGQPQVVAQGGFTDWKWSIAVEQGATCPPPPTHLPSAQCFIDCGGQ